MNRIIGSSCVFLLVASVISTDADAGEHDWPIQPVNQEHPLGAALGEFQDTREPSPRAFQHTGLDILAPPCVGSCSPPCVNATDDATDPCVFVTVGGTVDVGTTIPDDSANVQGGQLQVKVEHIDAPEIVAVNTRRTYRYVHLEHDSYLANFMAMYKKFDAVSSGIAVARVNPYSCGSYSHMHYDILERDAFGNLKYLNPLADLDANADQQPPEVFDVNFAVHGTNPWIPLNTKVGTCTVVKGNVDIVAQLLDRNDVGSPLPGATNIGVYGLRWRVCPGATSCSTPWNSTHVFSDMPSQWEGFGNPDTAKQFSTACPWKSNFDECSTAMNACSISASQCSSTPTACSNAVNETFMVATSSPSASWDTTAVPDGSYAVSVEASDFAGNKTTKSVQACVQNKRQPNPPSTPVVQ